MPEFNLNHLVLSDDGSWHLIAEQFYITQTTQMVAGSNGHMQSRTVTNYNFNDVIVIKMNSNGEVVFNTKIVKEQSSSNGISPALSYVSGYCNGDIYIVYNEHIFSKNNNVIACKISSDGTLTQEAIIKAKDERFEIYPTYSMYIKNCQIMLYIDTKKRYQFNFMNIQ